MSESIGIFGLGLMGASLARALREHDVKGRINGYARREATVLTAQQTGWFDRLSNDASEIAAESDLLVLCTPVAVLAPLLKEIAPHLREDAVITDVGSTKGELARTLPEVLNEAGIRNRFIGSHPMCGSEQTGLGAACPELYRGATVVVVPDEQAPDAQKRVSDLWTSIGSNVVLLDAEKHDLLVARTSHLPHAAAAVLMAAVAREGIGEDIRAISANGLRDSTRVAAGSPELWRDILLSNRAAVSEELGALAEQLQLLRSLLDAGDADGLETWLSEASEARKSLDTDG